MQAGIFFLLVSAGILIHHFFVHKYWLDVSDMDSHEFFAVFFLGLGLASLGVVVKTV